MRNWDLTDAGERWMGLLALLGNSPYNVAVRLRMTITWRGV